MSRNIHFTPQHSKSVAPPASESAEDVAARTLGVDANTYWTDKDYTFGIVNRYAHARWYRLTVTKLARGIDYTIYTAQGRLDEEVVFEVAPGDEFAVTIAFGGDAGRDPRAPLPFEVYVQEYVTQDADSPHEFVMNETLRWIPRPNADTIFVTTPAREIRVRPWPWKQRVTFAASLVNRSYLPLTANVRALPGEDGVEAGLEGAQERLSEAVAPLREQPVVCDIVLEKRLSKPVLLTVDAQTRIPDLNMDLTTSPRTVLITPIGFLKVWHDWLVVALGAFLFVWACFGMPPVVRPATLLTLDFDKDLPQGVKPADLKVTLEPINTTAFSPREGKLLNGGDKNHLVYAFDWGWMRRGLRLGWNTYNLRLKVEAQPQSKSDNPYGDMIVAGGDVEKTTLSEGGGISAAHIRQPISFSAMKPAYVAIASGEPRAAFTYKVTDVSSGIKLAEGASKGEAAQIAVPMEAASRRVTVDVAVNNTPRESRPLPLKSGQDTDFGAWKTKEDVPIVIPPPITDKTKESNKAGDRGADGTSKAETSKAGMSKAEGGDKGNGSGKSAGKQDAGAGGGNTSDSAGHLHGGHKGQDGGRHPTLADQAALVQAKIIAPSRTLRIEPFVDQLAKQAVTPGALHLKTTFFVNDKMESSLTVEASEDCFCQIYSIEGVDKVLPMFGKDGETPQDQNGGIPEFLKKGKRFTVSGKITEGSATMVVLAYRPTAQISPESVSMDLLPALQDPSRAPQFPDAGDISRWAIAVDVYPAKQ